MSYEPASRVIFLLPNVLQYSNWVFYDYCPRFHESSGKRHWDLSMFSRRFVNKVRQLIAQSRTCCCVSRKNLNQKRVVFVMCTRHVCITCDQLLWEKTTKIFQKNFRNHGLKYKEIHTFNSHWTHWKPIREDTAKWRNTGQRNEKLYRYWTATNAHCNGYDLVYK